MKTGEQILQRTGFIYLAASGKNHTVTLWTRQGVRIACGRETLIIEKLTAAILLHLHFSSQLWKEKEGGHKRRGGVRARSVRESIVAQGK